MCLQTIWLEPKIADHDITVYKELRKGAAVIVSPYTGFIYEPGVLYETQILETMDFCSFDDEAATWKRDMSDSFPVLRSIGAGFHSASTAARLVDGGDTIYECMIPKGSQYYMDGTGLIVSNKIQVIKPLFDDQLDVEGKTE